MLLSFNASVPHGLRTANKAEPVVEKQAMLELLNSRKRTFVDRTVRTSRFSTSCCTRAWIRRRQKPEATPAAF
jgi:hypothetical protein